MSKSSTYEHSSPYLEVSHCTVHEKMLLLGRCRRLYTASDPAATRHLEQLALIRAVGLVTPRGAGTSWLHAGATDPTCRHISRISLSVCLPKRNLVLWYAADIYIFVVYVSSRRVPRSKGRTRQGWLCRVFVREKAITCDTFTRIRTKKLC